MSQNDQNTIEVSLRPEGYVEILIHGDLTSRAILLAPQDKITALVGTLRAEGRPTLILMDVGKIKRIARDAQKEADHFWKGLQFDRMATYGVNAYARFVGRLMDIYTGRRDRTRYYDTRDQALKWLLAPHERENRP